MTLTTEALAELVSGNTLYHRLAKDSPRGEGVAVFFFGRDGRASARLPGGKLMRGDYAIEDGAYRVNWDGGLQNSRSTLAAQEDGSFLCCNASDGAVRSTVFDIKRGDAEGLADHDRSGR